MASTVYPKAKEEFLQGNIDLSAVNVKAVLIDVADYTYAASHDNLDDVAAAARVATSANLANKTFADGVFDADDVVFDDVSGDQCEAVIVFVDTGVESTSKLLAYVDSFASGMPVTPNGGDIVVSWNASGIFAL